MPKKIWLKPEQLQMYIKQLERFRELYCHLGTILESDKNDFKFDPTVPNFQNTLEATMDLHLRIRKAQSQVYGDVLFFNKDLDRRVQDLVEKSIAATFAYRDLALLIQGNDRNTETGLNKIEEQLYQAKLQLSESTVN